ncbi:MAG TPA: glycoside hydrolase family 15 protein [Burkholderiales bacterium]|nr:glycoside hydrolase family 15 protein [Burkholderiales bacterium]
MNAPSQSHPVQQEAAQNTTPDIADYALVGDCETAALVGRNGSVDWLCWPRFDSGACFAAMLGTRDHGRWLVTAADPAARATRAYREDTLILETTWETPTGAVTVIDFMPVGDGESNLVRLVKGMRGTVAMDMEFLLRFDYGASVPWIVRLPDANGICAIAGPDMAVLLSPVAFEGRDFAHAARFDVREGDSLPFVLTYSPSHLERPAAIDPLAALAETEDFWRQWCGRCTVESEWAAQVRRSLLTLKALTYAPTGGIVASPTTSLPEQIGGVRNWDYRFCWLRDATLTLLALMNGGYRDEAASWRNWLVRAVAGSPAQMQIMYGLSGERRLREDTLDWLPGFAGSAPVRVGNAAFQQLQLDVYGEVMDALHQARKVGIASVDAEWDVQRALLDHLESAWREPDEGLWEVRGPRRHFTYSKVLCWVAFDRGVKAVEDFGLDGPVERWRRVRDAIHADVCRRGYSEAVRSFVQSYDSTDLDASLLLIAGTGFLPWDDPRILSTVEAIGRHLTVDGLVLRYRTDPRVDALPPGEGVFLACSFWLADALCMQGRRAEAQALFERLLALANDVGLMSEEYDPAARRHLGNFPQAYSHVALINTAMNLVQHARPAAQRSNGKASHGHVRRERDSRT